VAAADPLGHPFADSGLLEQALRHRSAGQPHNERLEFLGDAVLNLVVAEALVERWPKADEGQLSRARSQLVCESSLAAQARRLGLGDRLVLGPGELKSGGRHRDSILADALEAVLGAIHLDAGIEVARASVRSWFAEALAAQNIRAVEKDAKTRLQEWLQARGLPLPEYRLVEASGAAHQRRFRVECQAGDPPMTEVAEAGSLRSAEQAAAGQVLSRLKPA
jgi:ribonuclease-3